MSCPHALYGTPATCSLCIGAIPRRVTQQGGVVQAEGEAPRPVDRVTPESVRRARDYAGRKAARRRRQG